MANKKYKDHTMGKGKARVTTNNQAGHDALEKLDWGHGPFKMNGFTYPGESPMTFKGANSSNSKCWPGYAPKAGEPKTKMSKTRPGVRVNNCS